MNMKNIGSFPHKIYSYHTKDMYGNVSLNKLLPLILDSAGSHAEILDISKELLLEKGYTWVLSRINLVLNKLVSDVDIIYVDTWIQKVRSAFSIRLFEVHDDNGQILARGVSYWSIIDTKTRSIAPIRKVIGDNDKTNSKEIPCKTPQKLIFEKGELVGQVIAQYSDLDYNKHVNSNRYVEWGINTLSPKFLARHQLCQLELNYNHEVYWNNEIKIYKTDTATHSDIELYNASQEQTACMMRLHFEPRDQRDK
ncbi:acyl-ACP thioesterase [Balneicella halophila]|uniref:Acyl-ACP thioesterase n=1 Tax=Balneicella halophila TaxID=1537566 RepID=A0A7L4USL4_BALHA|nr:acyl-ACP thioesterase domain-containing protein [Balneicella halophila]PVX52431.1 acyl-ACP thioesterase [Balneicella halophila]